ncbi:DsrE family protein [soil metagenome]
MKNSFLLAFAILFISEYTWAQSKPVKIVFDLTSKDTLIHQATLRHVEGMSSAYPDSEFEVVVYGGAISMVLNDKSSVAEGIRSFESNDKVSFKVCAGTMKRYNIDSTALLPGVDMVPDGILEIVNKQSEGWGYIKEAN